MRKALAFLIASALVTSSALAADSAVTVKPEKETASTTAYDKAMMKMHEGMDITYSGDADVDFVAGMLPHHQGAVDMAKVELQYGHDPELRKLATDIVAAQEKEIAFMKQWQAAHPVKK